MLLRYNQKNGVIIMKAILVDDEPLALEFLENQLSQLSNIEIVGKYTFLDIDKHAELIQNIDIIFLDVEMPEINGLELAEILLQENPDVTVIFVTAFNEYAVKAFELNALDYILKPVGTNRLERTLKRIEENIHNEQKGKILTQTSLRVNLCRDLSFSTEGKATKHIQWRTTKAKDLFIYLLHNHGHTNRKAELVDAFWGDLSEDRAYSQLYTAIYHIRKTIRIFDDHFSLRSLHEGYILDIKNVSIDIVEWENKLKLLNEINNSTISEWEKVMEIYTGNILEGYDILWIESERFRLEKIWIKTAFQIADFYKTTKNIENAERWYLNICNFRPEEEEAHLQLMQIYESLGLGLLIDHQYNTLRNISNDLEIDISPDIIRWYNNWRK